MFMSEKSLAQREASLSTLSSLIKTIDGKKVTLIGDTMLDRFHHGFANNLNSTAPVPVLKVTRTEESAGASAHIAIGLCSFGMNVSFHTCVGDDSEGESIIKSLDAAGVNTADIKIANKRSTLLIFFSWLIYSNIVWNDLFAHIFVCSEYIHILLYSLYFSLILYFL